MLEGMEYKLYYILLILEKTLPNISYLINMLFLVWGFFSLSINRWLRALVKSH